MELIDKLKEIEASYRELEKKMADPEIVNDPHEMQQLGKKHVELTPIVDAFSEYEKVLNGIAEAKEMAEGDDEEMRELAKDELAELEARVPELEREIRILLLPKDMNDEKKRHYRNPRRRGRRRGRAFLCGPLPHVHALRGTPALEDGDNIDE